MPDPFLFIKPKPSGPGPTAGFISLLSDKETNQRNRSLPGAFLFGCANNQVPGTYYIKCLAPFVSIQCYDQRVRLEANAVRLRGGCGLSTLKETNWHNSRQELYGQVRFGRPGRGVTKKNGVPTGTPFCVAFWVSIRYRQHLPASQSSVTSDVRCRNRERGPR